jgi:hypothetical protein
VIVYEVTAKVEAAHREKYEGYMRDRHIPDLLATGFFLSASFERSEPGRYRMRYVCESQGTLEVYLEKEAPRLRNDVTEHFPEGIELSREVWDVLASLA